MTLRVLISAPYIIPVIDHYRSMFDRARIEVEIAQVVERLSEEELLPFAGEIDGTVCGDDTYTRAVIQAHSPRLKVISKWGTGIDSIDHDAAVEHGIKVFNTPGAFTDPVADTVLEYILMFARKGPWMDREMKSGNWQKIPGVALSECTLGVVGVGRIGKAVLRRAKSFGMKLLGNDIVEIPGEFTDELGLEVVDLTTLLRKSDFISLNCDLNPTSYRLIDEVALSKVKPSAVLINTSRGAVVEQDALIEALMSTRLAGAALDVYEDEPLPKDSLFLGLDNVLLGAHNANSSPEAWERVHRNTIRNLFIGLGIEFPDLDSGEA